MQPFVILALPRSRTAWLSRFLSYGDWSCGHEELCRMRSMDDVRAWLSQPCTGTAETGAAPFWRMLPANVRVVVVRRPVADVISSLSRLPLPLDMPAVATAMRRLDQKLDQIEARLPGVLSVQFSDLAREETCARIFEHCLPYPHDPAWWKQWDATNVQINMRALARYYIANQGALRKLALTAKHLTIAEMRPESREMDGVTIRQEPFDTFYRDAQALFADHLVLVGETPDAFAEKNLPLMRVLDEIGAMQITTARCNGRMFGYLMTIISPSLESPDITSAINTTFYASPDFPGLGMKLQRASIAALRARGVDELLLRAGTRGDGPRMGVMYRRLGAQKCGDLYLLGLREAA
jgi:hypothetical protein